MTLSSIRNMTLFREKEKKKRGKKGGRKEGRKREAEGRGEVYVTYF